MLEFREKDADEKIFSLSQKEIKIIPRNASPITIQLFTDRAIYHVDLSFNKCSLEKKTRAADQVHDLSEDSVDKIMEALSDLLPNFETPIHDQGNWLIIKSPLFSAEYKWHERAVELGLFDSDEVFRRVSKLVKTIETVL